MALPPRRHFRSLAQKVGLRVASGALKLIIGALDVYAELLPGVRFSNHPRRRLPENLGAGFLGAEVATWWAISPSLLPRPWWATALNVAICQGVGHATGASIRFAIARGISLSPVRPSWHITRRSHQILHTVVASTTAIVSMNYLIRQSEQARLVGSPYKYERAHSIAGVLVGSLGYGAILLLGELTQQSIDRMSKTFTRWLPPVVSWPLATAAVLYGLIFASERLVIRRTLNAIGRQAQERNLSIFPGSIQPYEPERSGSPASYESWRSLGSQGRALVSGGPRHRDIAQVTGLSLAETAEPIRIYIGLQRNLSYEEQARRVLREMDRTGAFERPVIAMMAAAGTGWLTDWSISAFEFLSGGNCATVAIQYSYLPSAVAYITDHDSPVQSSSVLIRAIVERLRSMNPTSRPRFYVSGESLGAYGIIDSFDSLDSLLDTVDGAVFTGPPRFTKLHRQLSENRDKGSPERLPLIDGGRHVRFAAVSNHINHTFNGNDYSRPWEFPRIVFAQHASDPIVFWDLSLFHSRPDWLREPGSCGVRAPEAQQLDVYHGIRWIPFITGWQIGLDQVTSLRFPGGHAHQYHEEVIPYWEAVLGEHALVALDEELIDAIARWIRSDQIKR